MMSVKWKIVISTFQILVSNSSSFLIAWPKSMTFMLSTLSILNFDFLSLPQYQCFRNVNHYDRLFAATTIPLIFIAVVAACVVTPLDALARTKPRWYTSRHSRLALLLIVLFFAYSYASQAIAQTFVCQHFDDENKSFLRVDLSVRCGGPAYAFWTCFAVMMMFVWPIGMPTLFFCLCYRCRDSINPIKLHKKDLSLIEKERAIRKAIGQRQFDHHIYSRKMLWFPYEPEFWYWESVISAQRMLLTFGASLVKPGTPLQAFFCLITAIVFLRVQVFAAPYCHDHDDILAELLLWLLIFFYIQAIFYMLGYVNGVVLTVFICLSVALGIFGTIFLVFYDIRRELDFLAVLKKSIVNQRRSFCKDLSPRLSIKGAQPKNIKVAQDDDCSPNGDSAIDDDGVPSQQEEGCGSDAAGVDDDDEVTAPTSAASDDYNEENFDSVDLQIETPSDI